jgi:hypothetical protein
VTAASAAASRKTPFRWRFQIDHIRAEQHDGETVPKNLALACPYCNRYKGPNVAGFDPESGQLLRLFDPRTDSWSEHFHFLNARIGGISPVGRANCSSSRNER